MFAALPGNCWPWSQKAHTIIKRDAAFSTLLALSMRNPKARERSTLSGFLLGSSWIHKHRHPHAMHMVDTARPGVGGACGEGLASVILLCYFSCSEVNLTLSFISSAPFVHIMQFHMEVHDFFPIFNFSKCLCILKQEHPTSLHHSWEQQGQSGEPSSDWGGRAVTNHYFFPAQAIYSLTWYTLFFRYPTKTIPWLFTSLTPALLLLLLLKFLLKRTGNATSHNLGFLWEQWSDLKLHLPSE